MCTGIVGAPTTRGRRLRATACLCFLLAASTVLALSAFGQVPATATLEGTVRDFSGHVLPGSKLTLENMQTGITLISLTDSTGHYRIEALSPGVYRLRVQHPDFQPWQRSEVILNRGDMMLLSPTLDAVVAGRTNAPSGGPSAEEWQSFLPTLAEPMLFVVGIVTARWLLKRLYRAAVLRQMRRQKEPSQVGGSLSPNNSQAHIELRDVRGPSQEGLVRANAARRATRLQALGRWVAIALAALVQNLALGLFGGVIFNENPGRPLLHMIFSQGRLVLSAGFFLLAIVVPGLIRSGQTSAVSWWLFAVPPGVLMGLVPVMMFGDSEIRSPGAVGMMLAIIVVLGYGVLVGSLAAALLAKRVLRVSPEALAFILAGSVGAASNAGVLILQTGTSLGFWALFLPAEAVILLAPFVTGALTRPHGDPLKLLFLRTFRNAAASDRLLHKISRTWLTAGEIDAIAGPDIAASMASPEGVLRFATLLMGRHFIRSAADLETRVHSFGGRPALDGRYEVHEYPCFDNTWRTTMKRLVATADAILVDVRGYTAANLGTSYELTSLSELRALERTLLIAGESTPTEAVLAAMEAGGVDGKVSVFRVSDRRSRGEVGAVLFSLATREDRDEQASAC